MARYRKSPLEDVIDISSRLSWKINISLAVIAYISLHLVSQIKPQHPAGLGEMGIFTVKQIFVSLAMFGQFVLPVAFIIAAVVSFVRSGKQARIFTDVTRRQEVGALNGMSWREFEMLIGEYFQRSGFGVVPTADSADGGVDLKLTMNGEKYLVQCKQWRAQKVGVQPVREFFGVMTAENAVGGYFVTSGEFTDEAVRFADGLNLRLIDGRKLMGMIGSVQKSGHRAISAAPVAHAVAVPECPKCGERMVKRIARKGANAGEIFWGCAGYPQCNGVRGMEG